jgi:hypothetical protein
LNSRTQVKQENSIQGITEGFHEFEPIDIEFDLVDIEFEPIEIDFTDLDKLNILIPKKRPEVERVYP